MQGPNQNQSVDRPASEPENFFPRAVSLVASVLALTDFTPNATAAEARNGAAGLLPGSSRGTPLAVRVVSPSEFLQTTEALERLSQVLPPGSREKSEYSALVTALTSGPALSPKQLDQLVVPLRSTNSVQSAAALAVAAVQTAKATQSSQYIEAVIHAWVRAERDIVEGRSASSVLYDKHSFGNFLDEKVIPALKPYGKEGESALIVFSDSNPRGLSMDAQFALNAWVRVWDVTPEELEAVMKILQNEWSRGDRYLTTPREQNSGKSTVDKK